MQLHLTLLCIASSCYAVRSRARCSAPWKGHPAGAGTAAAAVGNYPRLICHFLIIMPLSWRCDAVQVQPAAGVPAALQASTPQQLTLPPVAGVAVGAGLGQAGVPLPEAASLPGLQGSSMAPLVPNVPSLPAGGAPAPVSLAPASEVPLAAGSAAGTSLLPAVLPPLGAIPAAAPFISTLEPTMPAPAASAVDQTPGEGPPEAAQTEGLGAGAAAAAADIVEAGQAVSPGQAAAASEAAEAEVERRRRRRIEPIVFQAPPKENKDKQPQEPAAPTPPPSQGPSTRAATRKSTRGRGRGKPGAP